MYMNKEIALRVIHTMNMVLMLCFSPIMLFVFLFALSDIVDRSNYMSPLVIEVFGYLIAVVFGLWALKNRHLLIISVLGWALLWWGNSIDVKNVQKGEEFSCISMRQDPTCVEGEDGSMHCTGGTSAGVYPRVCEGIPK